MKDKKRKQSSEASARRKKVNPSSEIPEGFTGRQGKKLYVVTSAIALPGETPSVRYTPLVRLRKKKGKKRRKNT